VLTRRSRGARGRGRGGERGDRIDDRHSTKREPNVRLIPENFGQKLGARFPLFLFPSVPLPSPPTLPLFDGPSSRLSPRGIVNDLKTAEIYGGFARISRRRIPRAASPGDSRKWKRSCGVRRARSGENLRPGFLARNYRGY